MSGSQSPWRYRNLNGDSGKIWHHPFNGLPIPVVDQIITEDTPHLGTGGLVSYFNHFDEWTGPVAEGTAGGWTLTGTTGTATIVHSDTKVGAIVLTTDNTGSATFALQRGNGTTGMNMAYTVGKRMWFFIRFKLLTVASMELFMGLGTADTSPSTTGTFPSDGIFFEKAAAATVLDFHARKDGTSGMNMAYTVGKQMWFFIRFKLLTVASMELFMGLGTADTSPSTTGTFPSDGIFFEKAAAATVLDFHARKDGTSTEKTGVSGTLVDDTYTIIGFNIDELGNIMAYQDGAAIATSAIVAGTANIPAATDVMQLNLAFIGQAMTMTVDWVLCAQEL